MGMFQRFEDKQSKPLKQILGALPPPPRGGSNRLWGEGESDELQERHVLWKEWNFNLLC